MKIQCQSCQAKYTIADEKVLGKVVKIRCKKCSATIVINGNEQAADAGVADTQFDYANQSGEQWTVNVADGDQRTMTAQEIAAEYKTGTINDETYCWKDGMADWLPLREIDQLYSAARGGGANPRSSVDDISIPPQSVPPPQRNDAPLFSGGEVASAVDSPFAAGANGNGNGGLFAGGMESPSAPAAARRGGGRGQGADLFGNVEKAGGEDDVMTSAAAGGMAASAVSQDDAKLTGQRNENSVLFSLSALTENKSDTKSDNRTTASADGSGLIDIRALSKDMDSGEKKKDTGARVDDIMNLSGGGAFGAALAAPILAPPPAELALDTHGYAGGTEQKSNKTLIFAILGGCAFIAIAIVVVAVVLAGSGTSTADGKPTPSADPTGMGSIAMNDTPPTATVTAPPPTSTEPSPPPPGTGGAAKPGTVNKPESHGGGGGHHAPSKPAAADPGGGGASPPTPPPNTPSRPADLGGAMAAAAGATAAPAHTGGGGGSTAPFDRGAAAASLGAVNVQSCKKPDGPTGSGHVTVTFSPDGSVASAVVDSGPFPGTPVGGCIAGKYRGARVPAFGGAPVKVGKSFTVN